MRLRTAVLGAVLVLAGLLIGWVVTPASKTNPCLIYHTVEQVQYCQQQK